MKILKEFVLREIAGDTLLVPTGKTSLDMNGMLTMNAVGADIWKLLPEVKDEEELTARLLEEYEVEPEELHRDVGEFLDRLRELGILG